MNIMPKNAFPVPQTLLNKASKELGIRYGYETPESVDISILSFSEDMVPGRETPLGRLVFELKSLTKTVRIMLTEIGFEEKDDELSDIAVSVSVPGEDVEDWCNEINLGAYTMYSDEDNIGQCDSSSWIGVDDNDNNEREAVTGMLSMRSKSLRTNANILDQAVFLNLTDVEGNSAHIEFNPTIVMNEIRNFLKSSILKEEVATVDETSATIKLEKSGT